MKYKTITVTTNHNDADLISCAMFEVGAQGVNIIDKLDYLELIKNDIIWDYIDENVFVETDDVKVSTNIAIEDKSFLPLLQKRLDEMAILGVQVGEIDTKEIDAQDYENEWKKYYKPIVCQNITIVPKWIDYQSKENEIVMKLDPGMAFGTGSHATTHMCLDFMDVKDKTVIDVGCGSGILGIASKLCGAKSVYMCDIDNQAVEFASKNADLNQVDVEIEHADLIKGDKKADVIFANLTADILMRLTKNLKSHLNKDGQIIVSGIIDSRVLEMEKCFIDSGFEIIEKMIMDEWCAMRLK